MAVCLATAAVVAWSASSSSAEPSPSVATTVADEAPGYAVEDFNYPGADWIQQEQGIVLKRGDGHIVLAECGSEEGLMELWVRYRAEHLAVFSHTLNGEKRTTPLFGPDQDLDTVSGGAEAGDRFGAALALAPYRPSGAARADESILAVGSPGEMLSINGANKAAAGSVHTFRIAADGTYKPLNGFCSGTKEDDISGASEAGDHFGSTLSAVNTAPRAVSTTATMKLAVGIPDEALGSTASAGAVHVFSLLGSPGANDEWIERRR
ncbi:hypothetical protein ACFUAC_06180 [Streptomyces sp. NPDC057148]|uniref:hypothetical protein n=1 Tax=unclassified Streptomyces TaxID=2593676 RepID=UPI00363C1ED5